jgi:DNA-binding MarR family transcriptional regulator
VIDLLGRKKGAGIEELASATGWLPHTTRAALTGLRKRGYAIERSRSEQGGSVYRIVTGAAPALAA